MAGYEAIRQLSAKIDANIPKPQFIADYINIKGKKFPFVCRKNGKINISFQKVNVLEKDVLFLHIDRLSGGKRPTRMSKRHE